MTPDKVYKFCPNCDEEYELPEDLDVCVICGQELINDYMLPEDDLANLF